MKLILCDPNLHLCNYWKADFKEYADVEIVHGAFERLPEFNCMVSAANSFGLMDGGVDYAIIRFFGVDLEYRVRRRIIEDYLGEQPVGTSIIVETGHPKHPFIAHTPTMRIPMTIAHTDNVYLAMWAMLRAVHHHNKISQNPIHIVACPGLGTGTGKVPFKEASRQMALAYKNYLKPPTYIDWGYASQRQLEVRYGGDDGFRFPPEE
jgi:O-acetyl-ADP-ribose deacetylase (regulator of RNase III)